MNRLDLDKEIFQTSLLSAEEERILFQEMEKGNLGAKKNLIEANLRLVIYFAQGYRDLGLELEDLVQEGVLGLFRAVEKFDWQKGYKFSTYATWWIKQAMSKAIQNQSRMILKVISLDTPINEEKETLLDFIEDRSIELEPGQTQPEKEVSRALLEESIKEILSELCLREQTVLIKRFGLFGEKPCTLKEIGQEMERTKQRIYQIEERALRKLKNPKIKRQLKKYLE